MATGLYHEVPTPKVNEKCVNDSVMFPRGNSYARGKTIVWKRDADGNSVGRKNENSILHTREYHVEFDDGEVSELTANVIAYSMYAACDDSGKEYIIMDSILDYQKSNKAILVSSQKVLHRGQSFMRRSTVGWHLCVQWRYGSTSWKYLNYLK